jgi:hypothetical protein
VFSPFQQKKDGGGWALPGFSLFSDDSDSDYNRDRDSDDDSKASDDSISDVSDDDLKGGGKHRKRRRQNDWRWAIVCGLLFLAFVFYEEILDAAVGMCAMSLPGVTRLVYTWTLPYWL